MQTKGQISLEFILILASFLGILSLFFPQLLNLYNTALLGLETQNAKNFLNNLVKEIQKISIFENNSQTTLEFSNSLEWEINISQTEIFITIFSDKLNQQVEITKSLSLDFPINYFTQTFSKNNKTKLLIRKQDNQIFIEESFS